MLKKSTIAFYRYSLGALAAGQILLATSAQSASLEVEAGQAFTLNDRQQLFVLDKLVLRDNSQLLIPSNVEQISLSAKFVEIGENVVISAFGQDGEDGQDADETPKSSVNKRCFKGQAGLPGRSGEDGEDGKSLNLSLAIAKIGSLTIKAGGGAGGQGGSGTHGTDASQIEGCKKAKGGNGGPGGNAGEGGDGGDIVIEYSLLSQNLRKEDVEKAIKVENPAGLAGEAGRGGQGGEGTKGYYGRGKTLAGNQKWYSKGKPGKSGENGKDASNGQNGATRIIAKAAIEQVDAAPKLAQPSEELPEKPKSQEEQLQEAQDKILELEKRLRDLENKSQ